MYGSGIMETPPASDDESELSSTLDRACRTEEPMNWRRELVEQMKREQLDAAEMPLELPPPVGIIRVKQNVSGDGFLGNPAGAAAMAVTCGEPPYCWPSG